MLIPIYRLIQCALAMPKRDPRQILKGVYLKRNRGEMVMAATDGKVMLEHKFTDPAIWPEWLQELEPEGDQPDLELVLGADTVNEILKQCKASEYVFLTEPMKADGEDTGLKVLNRDKAEIKYAPDPHYYGKRRIYTMPAEIVEGKFPDYTTVLQSMDEKINWPNRRPVSITVGTHVMSFMLDLAKAWGESANDEKVNTTVTLCCYPEEDRTEHWECVAVVPRDMKANGRGLIMPIRTDMTKGHEPVAHYWPQAHKPYAHPVRNPPVPVEPDADAVTGSEQALETLAAVERDNGSRSEKP